MLDLQELRDSIGEEEITLLYLNPERIVAIQHDGEGYCRVITTNSTHSVKEDANQLVTRIWAWHRDRDRERVRQHIAMTRLERNA